MTGVAEPARVGPGMSGAALDILAALESRPERGGSRCKVQKLLDTIDDATPNKDRLVTAVEGEIPARRAAKVMSDLGLRVGEGLIYDHRNNDCICWR